MASQSAIEWTDATWNPVTGCTRVSPGCQHCYAERLSYRFAKVAGSKFEGTASNCSVGSKPRWTGKVICHERELGVPLGWRKPRRIFVNSVSDTFHERVPDEFIDRMFAVMALTPWHTYQVLTKRPERAMRYLSTTDTIGGDARNDDVAVAAFALRDELSTRDRLAFSDEECFVQPDRWPLPNVWLGTSVEDQARAEERIPWLLQCPAAVRFLSCEPLLGPVVLPDGIGEGQIHWVISGGESGPGARPVHPDWVRAIRDQCVGAGVPFFFKQWGDWTPHNVVVPFGDLNADCDADRVRLIHPGNETMMQVHKMSGGRSTIPGSRYVRRVGKKAAGRFLDGRMWDEMPIVHAEK